MAQKKDRSRFSIKFRENDPAHERTICILESQGQRNIAPFLVNAVLHYVQCSETPDVSRMLAENPQPVMNKTEIEDIVKEVLMQQGIMEVEPKKETKKDIYPVIKASPNIRKELSDESIHSQNMIQNDMREMIARTLSAFRNDNL